MQYVRQLCRISRALNMASLPADISIEDASSVIINQAEGLCHDKDSLVYQLRLKLKRLKDKLIQKVQSSQLIVSSACPCCPSVCRSHYDILSTKTDRDRSCGCYHTVVTGRSFSKTQGFDGGSM